MTENHPRAFKGIWIPREIWENNKLDSHEKILLSEIKLLEDEEKECTASNKYFAEFFKVDERTVQRWLEKLKNEGFITTEVYKEGFKTVRKITTNSLKIGG